MISQPTGGHFSQAVHGSTGPVAKSVREQIQDRLDTLSKKERRVAEYLLANPSNMLFATAAEVAQQAGVVPATVVRFARSAGFSGFTQFREALRSEYPFLRRSTEHLDEHLDEVASSGTKQLVDRVREQSAANLATTFAQLDPTSLDAAAGYLLAAQRVQIAATPTSRAIATQLHCALQTAEIRSQQVDDWADLLFAAPGLGAGDVVVGITVSSYMKVTVEALRLGRQAGARTIFLTDAPFAPGADVADVTLFFAPKAFGEFLSPLAGTAIVDCMAAGLAARAPERIRHAMQRVYDLMVAHDLSYR